MRARLLWAILVPAYAPPAALAAFDPTDVIQIQTTATLQHESNLFRLSDDSPPRPGIDSSNRSDLVRTLGLGLTFDKLISRQRFVGDLNLFDRTYKKNSNLDFMGGDANLSWLWQVGNYWSGEAIYNKRRTLGGFGDVQANIRDVIDTDRLLLSGGYSFHPRWRIGGELIKQEVTHSSELRRQLDGESDSFAAILTHRTPAKNSIGARADFTDRRYPNRITTGEVMADNAHSERRLSAVAVWNLTDALKLDAQLGHTDVKFDTLSQRDFSGVTWRAMATWEPTSKIRVSLNASKDVRLYEDISTSYIVVNGVRLSPVYALTPKINLQGVLLFEKRDYRGDPGFSPIEIPQRENKFRLARIALSYSPIRNVDLFLAYETGDLNSTNPLASYDYRTWSGTLRLSF
jgi:exopolysaccharide biosynthesis operon protein EpsL